MPGKTKLEVIADFGKPFRSLMNNHKPKLSQSEVGKMVGLSGPHIGSIARGYRLPPLDKLVALLDAVSASREERIKLVLIAQKDHGNGAMLAILRSMAIALSERNKDRAEALEIGRLIEIETIALIEKPKQSG